MAQICSVRLYERLDRALGVLAGLCAFTVYFLTLEPEVSFWDCPEYVVTAAGLEIGHPPGNALFSLAGRFFITLGGAMRHAAFALNLMSAILSALTVFFMFRSLTMLLRYVVAGNDRILTSASALMVFAGSLAGSFSFAFCDTFWFSAVEAEVYAFSSFFTAVSVWAMFRWARTDLSPSSDRWLILIAYLTGLSVGVHQLNLLCLPALALVFAYRRKGSVRFGRLCLTVIVAMLIIAAILFGMMSGGFRLAGWSELLAVNVCGLPYGAGAACYLLLTAVLYCLSFAFLRKGMSGAGIVLVTSAFVSSGFLFPGGNPVALAVSVLLFVCALVFLPGIFSVRVIRCMLWCGGMLFLGASVYLLIPIRAVSSPPLNTGDPSDVFSFREYVLREQYGSHPLLKGPTPESRRIKEERYDSVSGKYSYNVSYLKSGLPEYMALHGGEPSVRYTGMSLTPYDSASNAKLFGRPDRAYIVRDYEHEFVCTPELDACFSRIFSSDPSDRSSYRDWVGMTDESMRRVAVSEAIDKDGNFVNFVNSSTGRRDSLFLLKPTPAHHWQYFLGYQTGYMYLRYLMWNFSGRQNDVHSQGQADNGNFITGIPAIDSAMLGPQDMLPPELGKDNPGHREFYMIPFLLALWGIVWLARNGKRGRRADTFILVLFIMTGWAIVVYLNQTPSEPRERDYSFVGSFYAFCMWIAAAVFPLASLLGKCRLSRMKSAVVSSLLLLGTAGWILAENWPDHDRSGRTSGRDFALAALESLPRNAVLFTNGDNYTFPFWYLQEVEGVRRDVRIVNMAYLTTPWYAASLRAPAYGDSGVPMTARYDDIAYGAFSFTRLGSASDTVDAVTALKKLYSARSGHPAIAAKAVAIPAPDGTEIIVDLQKLAGGSTLRSQKLFLLDIIATNASQGWKRPLYFLSLLSERELGQFRNNAVREAYFARIIPSGIPVQKDSLDLESIYDTFMRVGSWGGMDRPGVYADRVTLEQGAYIRRMMVKSASALCDRGDNARALALAEKAEKSILPENIPFSASNSGFVSFNEGVALGSLYCRLSDSLSRPDLRKRGLEMIGKEIDRGAAYFKYRRSLSPRLRAALSINTRVRAVGFYGAVDAWLRNGGSPDDIARRPSLKGIDLVKEKESFLRNEALFALLRVARPVTALSQLSEAEYMRRPLSERQADTALWSLREEYFRLGGEQKVIDSYVEAAGIDWVRAETISRLK